MRQSPRPKARTKPRTAAARELARARRLAARFHGDARGQVIALSKRERTLPRYAVVAGDLDAMTYAPRAGKRSAWRWNHESGDRGGGRTKSPNRPLLAVDPKTRRPFLVPFRSPMRFSSRRGFVG